MRVKSFVPVVLACALLLGACTSSKKPGAQGSPAASGSSTTQIPVVKAGNDLAFTPKIVTISRGQSVTFMNTGSVSHTVTADSKAPVQFDQPLDAGKTISITSFTRPGTYAFHCKIHTQMTGDIVVI